MNKLNIKHDLSDSTIPCYDISEMSSTFQKETKKLTRLPYYKLEELKKQEEKKAKHRHKPNKKDDLIIPHVPLLDRSEKPEKKKRIILKKIKEEKPKTAAEVLEAKYEIKNLSDNKIEKNDYKADFLLNKKAKTNSEDIQFNKLPPNHRGNSLQMLKYSTGEITQRKLKLSRKQRKLQEAENTLGSFISKEEKGNFYNNNSNKFLSYEGEYNNYNNNEKYISSSSNMNSMNVNNTINQIISSNNVNNVSNINVTNTVAYKKTDNNIKLALLGKKKKRINKFKKAVYKYRFKKKQFIFNNVFKLENEEKDKINTAQNDNQIILSTDINSETNISKEIINKNGELKLEIQEKKEVNDNINTTESNNNNNKPNFIEKINFYAKENKYFSSNNTNIPNSNVHPHNSPNNIPYTNNSLFYNSYNPICNFQNNYYQYPYPSNYSQYYYPYYPMNMFNQQYYNNNEYNYNYPQYNRNIPSNSNYLNKFNAKIIPKESVANKNVINRHVNKNLPPVQNQKQEKKKKKKKKKKNKTLLNKFDMIDCKQIENLNKAEKKGFLFESVDKIEGKESENNLDNNSTNNNQLVHNPEEFKNYLKSTYHIEKDISNLNGIELNNYLKEHTILKKVDIKSLKKIADDKIIDTYIKNFEGIIPAINANKRIIREYVDQILDSELDKKFGDFIVKMRDLYYKKKQNNPLKAKRRFVVGMREIEKYLRLDEVKCLFVVPNIEKVEGENSLDDRLAKIFKDCETKKIPKIFGMNKFKLGKLARKKYSCVSMLAFVNVEGLEREFRDLIEFAEKFKRNFYEKYKGQRDMFKDNRFINIELYDDTQKNSNIN